MIRVREQKVGLEKSRVHNLFESRVHNLVESSVRNIQRQFLASGQEVLVTYSGITLMRYRPPPRITIGA